MTRDQASSSSARRGRVDGLLLAVTVLLCLFGLMMVYSSSAVISLNLYGDATRIIKKQILALAIGCAMAFIAARFDYRRLRDPRLVYGLVGFTLALLAIALFMPAVKGSTRWLRLFGLSFEPSEMAKLTTVLFVAYLLEKKRGRINDFFYTLTPLGIVLGTISIFILVQPDLGTTVVLGGLAALMLFSAGLSWSYVFGGLLLCIPAVAKLMLMAPYRRERILAFLSPWSDPQGYGFQPIQALIALGSGGVTGVGPGESVQKLFYLPEPHTDFVFAVLGEEFGLIGGIGVLCLFLVYCWRGVRAALHAEGDFGFYLATGITSLVVIQALLNISVAVSLLPTTGLTLPFISAGGSSLIVCLTATGLLLNVSRGSAE